MTLPGSTRDVAGRQNAHELQTIDVESCMSWTYRAEEHPPATIGPHKCFGIVVEVLANAVRNLRHGDDGPRGPLRQGRVCGTRNAPECICDPDTRVEVFAKGGVLQLILIVQCLVQLCPTPRENHIEVGVSVTIRVCRQ